MIFANHIVLVAESRHGVNVKSEIWQDALESKGFQIIFFFFENQGFL